MPSDLELKTIRELLEKATPGPWMPGHITDDTHSCNCRYIFGNDDRMGAVAEVSIATDDLHGDENPPPTEARANAALIALTPQLAKAYIALAEENERMRKALEELDQWSKAYPLDIFPEPDFAKVRELLAAGGITVDAVSASNMRHVITRVGEIARAALASQEGQNG